MHLPSLREKVNDLLAERKSAVQKVKEEKEYILQAEKDIDSLTTAVEISQSVAQMVEEEAHEGISAIVSRCLEAVFDNPYEFRILFNRKRNRTEAELVFFRDGNKLKPKRVGGGVRDVASFALRVAVLLLSRPQPRKTLVLDEPFKHLSADYMPLARDLVLSLAEEFSIQFVLVTHKKHLKVGKVISLD